MTLRLRFPPSALLPLLATLHARPALAADCPGDSTPQVEACERSLLAHDRAQLARTLAAAIDRLRRDRADPSGPAVLDAAQAAWTAYRDRECAAVRASWQPGTIAPTEELLCLRRLTAQRTWTLWRDWLTFGDSTPPVLPEPPVPAGR